MAQLKIRYLPIIVPLAFSMGQAKAQDSSLVSQSLVENTVIAPNGAVTVEGALAVNQLMGGDKKVAHEITNGVYHIRGWGIAHTIAIDAPALRVLGSGMHLRQRPKCVIDWSKKSVKK